ncbi:MAG TPA: hypothetical protein VJT14_02880 [Candidatus Dormibacteraeota bacterium]|nr:hypothetical protein [Candidatus Dormibacteraeota bacterium]
MATVAWAVVAVFTLVDLADGATAPTYVPSLVAGAIPVAIALVGVSFYGGLPRVTLRAGCLGAAWGVALLFFIGGIYGTLDSANTARLSGPSYQAEASKMVRAVVVEAILTLAVTAGIGLWRRQWFPTLVAGATLMCIFGLFDLLFFTRAFSAVP